MLLRPVSSPPPHHLPAARRAAAPATATAPFFLVLRRRQWRRHHRPYFLLRASISDLLASIPASLALVGPAAAAAAAAVASSLLSPSSSSYSRSRLPPPSLEPDPEYPEACGDVAGEWILFSSPTPFNRCVLLRCPSVSFEDGGMLLDGVNERLLTEERHYVNLSRGRIPAAVRAGDGACDILYQRICIPLGDGGVIALDWPDNLDLDKEHGLDSTVLIVPGTPDGSNDRGIRMFVLDALKNGYFPIVVNPRGCGGSPLTTPRLFTAADSDDISTAIRFINSKRPWTTLMGVGWGYGANMLTKYLVEVGESTPITAAVCIDNPFDLQEATRSFPHHIALDRKLTAGLVNILRSNKELFQGKAKNFDVQKALSANSLRDFDGAISMVSHGFDTVDDFYSENSTRLSVVYVKIPVLFIQSDDGTVPLLSVPRSSISENPFTSLLLCSCIHSTVFTFDRYAVLWCQNIALEWLSAVEFALLKGRHPLIKDVDITINPSKGVAFVESETNDRNIPKVNNFHQRSQFILYNNVPHGINGLLVDSAKKYSGTQKKENVQFNNNVDVNTVNKDSEVGESEESSEDVEKGQVLQSATLVMNMLDATLPGTLDDDQKKKVLVAVEQGESLVKALEEAVPEDVRGKLTNSVTEILQSKREKFNLESLKRLGWANAKSTARTAVQERIKDSDQESGMKDAKMNDQNKNVATIGEGEQKDTSLTSNDKREGTESTQGKPSQNCGPVGTGTEIGSEQTQPNKSEKANSGTNESAEQTQLNKSEKANSGTNESAEEQHRTNQGNETSPKHVSDDQSVTSSNEAPKERVQSPDTTVEQNTESHVVEKEGDTVRTTEDKPAQNSTDQNMQASKTEESKPPPINVTQALDALTGFDDSTQMAVNSVFGVLENMIDQFEKQHDSENGDSSDETTGDSSDETTGDRSDGTTDGPSVDGTEPQVISDMERESIAKTIDRESSGKTIDPSYQREVISSGRLNSIMSEDHTDGQKNSNLSIVSSAKGKIRNYERYRVDNCVDADVRKQASGLPDYLLDVAVNSYLKAQYALYLHEFLSTKLQLKSPDLNSATDLFLDPQEGKWKIADQMANVHDEISNDKHSNIVDEIKHAHSSRAPFRTDNVIEPPCLVMESSLNFSNNTSEQNNAVASISPDNALRETLTSFIIDELENALKIEVGRKIGITSTEQLERNLAHDVERLAAQVSRAIVLNCELYSATCVQRNPTTVKFGTILGENVIEAVSTAVQESHDLRNILPVGVIVGVTLASLRNYFHVGVSKHDQVQATVKQRIFNEDLIVNNSGKTNNAGVYKHDKMQVTVKPRIFNADLIVHDSSRENTYNPSTRTEANADNLSPEKEATVDNLPLEKQENTDNPSSGKEANTANHINKAGGHKQQKMTRSQSRGMMVGAVTAALGASALVAHHHQNKAEDNDCMDAASTTSQHKLDETAQEKNQNNLMSSFAEKALSVAAPVVPTKGDGEVDHERLVAVLAELGQKGGILRFVGKIALLWGGIRGAMSLTDRLISFLHISERPLFQRIIGFSFMVLVLWSPVVIPLLPTLVQSWTISASTGIIGYACIVGLYASVMILVMLWGKRIRGYDNPVEQYGMNLASASRAREFFQGLVGGVTVVGLVHSITILLGFSTFRVGLSSVLTRPFDLLKSSSNVFLLALRGFVTATSISVVEELVFRSWLPEEIAVDLGYYNAILISGVVFSLIHRSLPSIPGFLLLSMALFGLKQKTQGKLAAPIGLRSGIMTASYLIQTSGIIASKSNTPFWMISTYHLHPFDGVIGLSICALLAILLFPQKPVERDTSAS